MWYRRQGWEHCKKNLIHGGTDGRKKARSDFHLKVFVQFEVFGPSIKKRGADVEMEDGESVGLAPIRVP